MNRQEFANPGPAYRAKPFWAWNGRLEEQELLRQIDCMADMGFGGFFMHSRTGLQTEYLGEEWFRLINACADYSEGKALEAWLYDEDRWPSGLAGGLVTEGRPEYWMKAVRLEVLPLGSPVGEGLLACFSCKLAGDSLLSYAPYTGDAPAEHDTLLIFRLINTNAHPVYNGAGYVDTMNPEAVRYYIDITHGAYLRQCGDRLGRSIKGIFTDEPHRGTLMDSFGSSNGDDNHRIPWTPALPEEFRSRFGYDLVEKLPELYYKPKGDSVAPVKQHYVECCQQLFLENFMAPINRWCADHGILLTGHLLHEDCLTAQTVMNGSMIRNYEHLDYPGVDVLSGYNFNYWIVKQVASAARQLGKPWILSELYGCSGWQMKLEDYKRSGDWQALFGVNLRCPHLSWYTMEGEGKRDYPASIFFQSAWYREYKALEDYYARIALVMSQGEADCHLLVVSPLESVWSQISLGYANCLSPAAPEIQAIEERYRILFAWLSGGQVDFDYGDEDFLLRMGAVEDGSDGVLLRVGKARYDTVLVSGLVTIRESSRQLLADFAAKGGKVVFAGEHPGYVDALPAATCSFGEAIPFVREELLSAVGSALVALEGNGSEKIYAQMRRDGDLRYLMLLSIEQEVEITVSARLPVGAATLLDCRQGKEIALATDADGEVVLHFAPGEEKLLRINTASEPVNTVHKAMYGVAVSLGQPVAYTLDEPNALVLDMGRLSVAGGEFGQRKEVLQLDRDIRDAVGLPWRGGEMLQPWYQEKHAATLPQTETMAGSVFTLAVDLTVEVLPNGPLWLAVEHPERLRIAVNGITLGTAEGYWVDPCLQKLPIPANTLVIGENKVTVEGEYRYDSGLEAMFLLGAFGVQLAGEPALAECWDYSPGTYKAAGGVCVKGAAAVVTRLPERLMLGSLADQGLPFYSGKVGLRFPLPAEAGLLLSQPYQVELDVSGQDALWLELVLTRRNAFGPFHALPVVEFSYGPDSFLRCDTDGYGLLCNGLTAAPVWQRMVD